MTSIRSKGYLGDFLLPILAKFYHMTRYKFIFHSVWSLWGGLQSNTGNDPCAKLPALIVVVCCFLSALENYAKWQFIQTYIPVLDEDCLAAYRAFRKATRGDEGENERYETCIGIVEEILPYTIVKPFAEKVFPDGARVRANFVSRVCS